MNGDTRIRIGDAVAPAQIEQAPASPVLYMGIPYPVAKRLGNVWYHETPEGFKPFALQGRVRRIVDPQSAPR